MGNRKKPASAKPSRETVVVGYVHPAEVSAFFHQSMLALALADSCGPRRIVNIVHEFSSANISHARNEIVRKFLAGPGDWLLFVDSDMNFEPDLIEALLFNADPTKAPIVGGLCFGTNDGRLFPTLYTLARHGEEIVTIRHTGEIPEATMMQVAATGAAALLIHRSVLAAVEAHGFNKTFPWFQETELSGRPCGEDFTFCLRAGQLGFPVYVNTAVEVGHHKSTVLDLATYAKQQEVARVGSDD